MPPQPEKKSNSFSIRDLSPTEHNALLDELTPAEQIALAHDWETWGRPDQQIPQAILEHKKSLWLPLAGRGWGKTRTGAEAVRGLIETGKYRRIALVAATAADARDVMVGGESGLLSIFPPGKTPLYEPSKRCVTFHNGAQAFLYSAEEPGRLRGPQHDLGWADEVCVWKRQQETWDMYEFGLRLGPFPISIVTTTPKPTKFLKELIADPDTITTKGRTLDNAANLAPKFIERIRRRYEGTRLGRQELNAEILDDNPSALFSRGDIEKGRVKKAPKMARIAVGVDPAVSNSPDSDDTGIIAAGIDHDGHGYVLDDTTINDTVTKWAMAAVHAYDKYKANMLIGEVNNGGDLIETVIRQAEKSEERDGTGRVAYQKVTATRGKAIRAEFLTLLYQQGRIHHVGAFAELEDEMCEFDPTLENQPSPNRMDALVWAMAYLFGEDIRMPSIRVI